jgi:tetratricopeptide (TPR) repeat protein
MRNNFFIKIIFIFLLLISSAHSKESNHFEEGKKYFNNKEFDKSKILFERNLVFDPKSEQSYLYLAKIFMEKENIEEQEINLKSVLLLNPKNDEALYMLTLINIKKSDYNMAKELIDTFKLVCKSFCSKKEEIETKLKKMTPDNEKSNN